MVEKSHFRLLSHLVVGSGSEVGISTLADQLDWSAGHTSRIVSELEAYGYVRTKQSGRQKLVSPTEIEPIEQLEGLLTEYSHMDLPDLIAGAGLLVLYYLDQGRTATELAELSGVSQATIYRRLDDFQRVGVVGKSTSQYRLNDPLQCWPRSLEDCSTRNIVAKRNDTRVDSTFSGKHMTNSSSPAMVTLLLTDFT